MILSEFEGTLIFVSHDRYFVKKLSQKLLVLKNDGCEFYEYDEYTDTYSCTLSLDEDEMVGFLGDNTKGCHYYRYYDEYKSVHKQIWYYEIKR